MKKLLLVLMGCSLALASGAQAADQPEPPKKQAVKKHAANVRPEQRVAKPQPARHQPSMAKPPQHMNQPAVRERTVRAVRSAPKAPVAKLNGNAAAKSANINRQQQAQEARAQSAIARKTANPVPNPKVQANVNPAQIKQTKQANRNENQAARKLNAQANKPNIQAIRAQRANFKAQARPEQIKAVTFNQNYRIRGASNWRGAKYNVFRNYRAERHDREWYHSRYNRISLFGGGYYYWNSGYWYPAWGYDASNQYYAYDGPIYVGRAGAPVDRVIAEVQDALQQQGYYHGEVDGLLGPLTRQALTDYQSDNGIYTTATIDEPTLESLGLS